MLSKVCFLHVLVKAFLMSRSFRTSTLNRGVELFFSRNVKGNPGEDLVEKQNAESGVMPLVSDEAHSYGYCWEDRFFNSFYITTKPLF